MSGWMFAAGATLIPVVACALAFIPLYRRWPPLRPGLPLLLFFALAIRWFFLVLFPNPSGGLGFDAESFRIVGELVRSGKDVYAATDRHPYLPFQMYFIGLASWLGAHTGPDSFTWVRWPNILADLGIVVLIYRSALQLRRGESEAFWLAFIWALHPVSIYTSTIHGQFDSVALFFSLWAWYALRFWPGWKGAAFGGVALGFAILDKTWPAIFVLPFVVMAPQVRMRMLFLAGVALVPLAALALYGVTFGTTLHLIDARVVGYQSVPDRYGFTFAFKHYLPGDVTGSWLPIFQKYGTGTLLVSTGIVAAIVVPRRDAMTSCVALLATFLVFTPGWGSQYLVWMVPFVIVARQRAMLAAYSAVATAALFVYYWGACGYYCPGRISIVSQYWEFELVWPLAMFWLLREALAAMPLSGAGRRRAETTISSLDRRDGEPEAEAA